MVFCVRVSVPVSPSLWTRSLQPEAAAASQGDVFPPALFPPVTTVVCTRLSGLGIE